MSLKCEEMPLNIRRIFLNDAKSAKGMIGKYENERKWIEINEEITMIAIKRQKE